MLTEAVRNTQYESKGDQRVRKTAAKSNYPVHAKAAEASLDGLCHCVVFAERPTPSGGPERSRACLASGRPSIRRS
jgi:hypothetical protein